MDRIQLWQALAFLYDEAQTHRFDARLQSMMIAFMARPGFFQPLVLQDHQCFMQTIQRVDWRGVVVGALAAAPVTHHQIQVEEPALHFGFARLDSFHSAFVEAHRG